jgi:hypothetical protein
MSNLNKFQDSHEVLEKKSKILLSKKKKFKDSQGMSKQLFFGQDSYHKHLRY